MRERDSSRRKSERGERSVREAERSRERMSVRTDGVRKRGSICSSRSRLEFRRVEDRMNE